MQFSPEQDFNEQQLDSRLQRDLSGQPVSSADNTYLIFANS